MENKKKKIELMHIFRRIVQIIFFIFLPGIFTSVFYAIKEIYLGILGGNISISSFAGPSLILLGILFITIFFGRFFCGFICSFGAMGDLLWFISEKTIKTKFQPGEKLDAGLKLVKYGILIFIFFGLWTFQLITIDSMSSPWTIFGMYTSIGNWTSLKYLLSVGGFLLLLIILGSLFIERFFCRYLCPLGAIFALISKVRFFHITKNRDKCGICRVCTNSCPMGITLYQYDKITSGECINCFTCVENCPRENVKANPVPVVASAVSVTAIAGVIYAGTIVSTGTLNDGIGNGEIIAETGKKGNYIDGTYSGVGIGFRGETKVSVTVENGNISDITVISYQDDMEYFKRAQNIVISQILEVQNTDVDAVSGATFSSNGIIEAVNNALASIDISKTVEKTETDENSNDTNEEQITESNSQIQSYEDGIYSGTGNGFRGETEVSVIVEDEKISDISIVSYQDDEQFFSRAEGTVISEIIQNQDINVDAVSGATFSSNGIKEAVANALGISFTNPNDSFGSNKRGGHKRGGFH